MRRVLLFVIAIAAAAPLVVRPGDVPRAWAPWTALDLDDPPNIVWRQKVRMLGHRDGLCRAAVAAIAGISERPDHVVSPKCGIAPHVEVTGLSMARVSPLNTQCSIAARMYLWEKHSLQPAAKQHLGTTVARINHYASFACRGMRTSSGVSTRMSQHATANAVDISGFRLADGRQISLLNDWKGSAAEQAFLREARDGLCTWFNTVLSPDYNALHADHFHADMGPWPICR